MYVHAFSLYQKSCAKGKWKPFFYKNSINPISYMSFPYDIVIFRKASIENVQNMLHTIEEFYLISGQNINFNKSQVICVEPFNQDIATFLFREKGFICNIQDIQYLGFTFLKNARSIVPFQKIYTHLKNKVKNWKFMNLSQAGRMVMLKSVLLALPTYLM